MREHKDNPAKARAFVSGGLIGMRVACDELGDDAFDKLRFALYEPSFRLEQAVRDTHDRADYIGAIGAEARRGKAGADPVYWAFACELAEELKTPFQQNNFRLGFGFIMHKMQIAMADKQKDQREFEMKVTGEGRDWDMLFKEAFPD